MRRLILFSQLASLAGIGSVGPPPKLTESNVNIVMAKKAGPEGPSCVTDTFTLEERPFAYVTFRWDDVEKEGGPHRIEAKWYSSGKLLSAGVRQLVLGRPPYHLWFSVFGTDLGVGKAKLEMYADGLFVGSKTFEVVTADPSSTAEPLPVHIEGDVKAPVLLQRIEPTYPQVARKARMEGVVILEAIITQSGCVENVKVLQSVTPLLDAAAVRAVQQWTYKPATLEGRRVRVYLTVTITFHLH